MGAERLTGITTPGDHHHHDLPLPEPDTVDVWVARLDPDSGELARRVAATSGAERQRASRFRRRLDADRYLAAHGALRLLLADYLACDPLSLRVGTHENGKPFLEGARLEFNLSHSGAVALIAVARSRQVGVDVEQLRPMADLDRRCGSCLYARRARDPGGPRGVGSGARIPCNVDVQGSAGEGYG